MPRLVKSVEKRPEEAIVINWTVPVYIKNGEDYYKVCFDIKRKPLPDGTLPLTESELMEFEKLFDYLPISKISIAFFKDTDIYIQRHMGYLHGSSVYTIDNYKAILWLAERFELIKED